MRYPVLTTADANTFLNAKRSGAPIEAEQLVKLRGDGPEMDQSFVDILRVKLEALQSKFPGNLNHAAANSFESMACREVHSMLPDTPEVLADGDFWTWLAVLHFAELVNWRYGRPEEGAALANYGVGNRAENFLYRLWLRAEIVLDEASPDRYHLSRRGQGDFYRSHLFRPGYSNARSFARAFMRFQYPYENPTTPRLKINEVRDLAKRLSRLRPNLVLDLLSEEECLSLIQEEAVQVENE
jgi:hypothetical protein